MKHWILLALVLAACGDDSPKKKSRPSSNNSTNNTVNNTTNNAVNNATNNAVNNATNNATNNNTNSGGPTRLHVRLDWETPADTNLSDFVGADLDVHLGHPNGSLNATRLDYNGDGIREPWGDSIYDCSWKNPQPKWGDLNTTDDDPVQDRDDTDGVGPENIELARVEPVLYRVAAGYYNDSDYGPSTATLSVFLDGNLVYEESLVMSKGQLWEVATINGATGEVVPSSLANGDPFVISPIP